MKNPYSQLLNSIHCVNRNRDHGKCKQKNPTDGTTYKRVKSNRCLLNNLNGALIYIPKKSISCKNLEITLETNCKTFKKYFFKDVE